LTRGLKPTTTSETSQGLPTLAGQSIQLPVSGHPLFAHAACRGAVFG
jgi:hypothetical protein